MSTVPRWLRKRRDYELAEAAENHEAPKNQLAKVFQIAACHVWPTILSSRQLHCEQRGQYQCQWTSCPSPHYTQRDGEVFN